MPLRHDIRRGALLMLGATALFTIMSAIIKGVSDEVEQLRGELAESQKVAIA